MYLQNEGLAAGLGRPELAIAAQSYNVAGGQPPLVPGGPAAWLDYIGSPKQGQASLSIILILVVALIAFHFWTKGAR